MPIYTILQNADMLFMGTTAICSLGGLYLLQVTKALKAERNYAAEIINSLQEGFYKSTLDGKQMSANPALARMNGYKNEQEMLDAVKDIACEWYVEPERREKFKEILFNQGKVTNFVSQVYRHKTREPIWVSENARLVSDRDTSAPLYYEGTVREITEEVKYRDTQHRLFKLAENLPGGLFQLELHADGRFTAPYLSNSFIRLLGRDVDQQVSNPNSYLKYVHPEDLASYLNAYQKSAKTLEPIDYQFRYLGTNEQVRWLHVTATPEKNADGGVLWHGHLNDITEQKQIEQKMERMAYYDSLTNLPKRAVFEKKLQTVIAQCNRRSEYAAMIFLDLNDFKPLNDSLGHECGDELLRQVAERLGNITRASDMVARYGGDEFVAVIEGLGSDEAEARLRVRVFGEKVLHCFAEQFVLNEHRRKVAAAVGVCLIDDSMPEVSEIIKQADRAMYDAKKSTGSKLSIYGEDKKLAATDMATIAKELEQAANRDEFELLYQPQFSAKGELVGAEAFIRWNHPTLGTLIPPDFMPHAERNGTINEIGNWVMKTAIAQLVEWKKTPETRHLCLSVNVGVQQFSMQDFDAVLGAALAKADIQRSLLTLELNESVLHRGLNYVCKQMKAIKKSGVRFSLDDFGTGSSSLSSLNMLPFDEIKIDGSFVSSIENKTENRKLIEGILSVAGALNLDTVAEHVSSKYQEKYLRERGCNRFQGYYYSPPLQLAEFNELALGQQNVAILVERARA